MSNKKEETMQNKKILEILSENAQEEAKYSFVINSNQADKIIGNAKDILEVNNYIIKDVKIIFYTAQVIVVRSNRSSLICGWESNDSALMLSCIKRIYKERELIFDCITEE